MTTSDPNQTTNTHDYTVHENIYEGLYDLNEATGGYDLRLAEKIEANEDATEYIVTLRQGVKFHNGETMTADDVVFSYDLAQNSPKQASYVRPLDHVEKVDDYTVRIVMNQSFSPIGHMLHIPRSSSSGRMFSTSEKIAVTDAFFSPGRIMSFAARRFTRSAGRLFGCSVFQGG